VVPKFEPAIVTEAPTAPEFGLRLAMLGVVARALGEKQRRNKRARRKFRTTRRRVHLSKRRPFEEIRPLTPWAFLSTAPSAAQVRP
jgi:transposase InsO family protein